MQHRVVVIGVGSIGERHVRCFLATGRAEVALVEVNLALAQTVSQRYKVPSYPSIDAALGWGPTCAVVATPAPHHVAQAAQLVSADLNVLIEKPLSTSLEGVDRLGELVLARQRVVSIAYVYRAFPVLAAMRDALKSGRFGAPRQIVAVSGQHFPTYRPAYREIY
ncbi:MAG: Gfo/Idh/MocA family oxidoreductase [Planctomycetia bacterium]|nr:Gfo/Idh/MocA family oxidoreductase [Planctomycetia bacterium]